MDIQKAEETAVEVLVGFKAEKHRESISASAVQSYVRDSDEDDVVFLSERSCN